MKKTLRSIFHSVLLLPALFLVVLCLIESFRASFGLQFFKVVNTTDFIVYVIIRLLIMAVFGFCVYCFYSCSGFLERLFLSCGTVIAILVLLFVSGFFSGSTASFTDNPAHWGSYDEEAERSLQSLDLSHFPQTPQGEVQSYRYFYQYYPLGYGLEVQAREVLSADDYREKYDAVTSDAEEVQTTEDGRTKCQFSTLTVFLDDQTHSVEYWLLTGG